MKRILLIIIAILCSTAVYAVDYANVIVPRPVSCGAIDGQFILNSKSVVRTESASLVRAGEIFAEDLEVILGKRLVVKKSPSRSGAINLSVDSTLESEQYMLKITKAGIWIVGGSERAVFFGLQSLLQIAAASPVE
ncbi:MAG: glycoside hydrolase family 20 zincin-like fold domain-containing protein, partial [Alistipes sp.]|nr:glycoside hydrolase family 20 zincin-like fold domain-containing protein [Alistipes sp.]